MAVRKWIAERGPDLVNPSRELCRFLKEGGLSRCRCRKIFQQSLNLVLVHRFLPAFFFARVPFTGANSYAYVPVGAAFFGLYR